MPDIPATVAPGQALIDLGNSIEDIAVTLGGIKAQKDNAQAQIAKVYEDAAATTQYLAAQRLVDAKTAEFNAGLATDPNHQDYYKKWTDALPDIVNQASDLTTLPGAKLKLNEYLTGVMKAQNTAVRNAATSGIVKDAENGIVLSLQEKVAQGDIEGVKATIQSGVDGNIIGDPQTWLNKYVPDAKFNQLYGELGKVDYQSQIQILSASDAEKTLGVSSDQITRMLTLVKDKHASDIGANAEQTKADQEKTFGTFLKASLAGPVSMDKVDSTLLSMIGSPHYDEVKQYRDARIAENDRLNKEAADLGETAVYFKMATALSTWDGNGTAPVTPNSIQAAVLNSDPKQRITKADGDKLLTSYDQTMKDLKSGTRKGPNYDDPVKVAELGAIALDEKKTPQEKYDAMRPYYANGVSPSTYDTWRGRVDLYNGNVAVKNVIDPINRYYSALIQDPANDAAKKQELTLQNAAAVNAMMDVVRKYPSGDAAPAMWKQASDSIMDKDALPRLLSQVEANLKGRFGTAAWAAGQISDATQLETLRELAPEQFALNPGLVAQASLKSGDIAREEGQVLKGAGINIVDRYRDPRSGAWYYSTKPIPILPDGTVDLVSASKAGALYGVQETQDSSGKFIRKAVRWNVTKN